MGQVAMVEDHELAAHDGLAADQALELRFTASLAPSVRHTTIPQDESQPAVAGRGAVGRLGGRIARARARVFVVELSNLLADCLDF
jgi:hypothetical protein